jgi:hypothetical protein
VSSKQIIIELTVAREAKRISGHPVIFKQ